MPNPPAGDNDDRGLEGVEDSPPPTQATPSDRREGEGESASATSAPQEPPTAAEEEPPTPAEEDLSFEPLVVVEEEEEEESAAATDAGSAEERASLPARPAPVPEPWWTAAVLADPAVEVAFYESEAERAMPEQPRRAAPLIHEAGHLRDHYLHLDREAARTYAQALTLDPSFTPNVWALRRLFARRGLWDNLVRVCDAELRFAPWARPGDRADLHLLRGRILEDRLGREAEALESYRAALEVVAEHPGASLSLAIHGLRTGAVAEAEAALAALVRGTTDPTARASLALTLARLQRSLRREGDDGYGRAADTLLKALSAGADAEPLLEELSHLSLLADKVDLRLRYLDAYESRVGRDFLREAEEPQGIDAGPFGVALAHAREKARILLRRGARDAAWAVIDRTLRAAPTHPLALLDFLDASEEAGRADGMQQMLDGPLAALSADAAAEVRLRRAEIMERAGALGESIGTLDRIPPESGVAALAALARARVLARLQDADGLARTFAEQAERLASGEGTARREAAHLFVRAAIARHRALEDSEGAEALLRRALDLVPDYRPAASGLAAVLAGTGRFDELARSLEAEEALSPDPPRLRALRETLVTLLRDVLFDAPRALERQKALLAEGADVRGHLRTVDLAGMVGPDAFGDAVASLRWLAERAEAGTASAGLRILAARLSPPDARDELLRQAFTDDPSSTAGAALEERLRDPNERRDVLEGELRAATGARRDEVARALRFRLAHLEVEAGRVPEALGHLEPLRQAGDRLARAWSLDLARRAGHAAAEVALLRELDADADAESPADAEAWELTSPFERAWALGEALERAGEANAAGDAFRQAGVLAAAGDPMRWADVELGIFRAHARQDGDLREVAASLGRLGTFLEGEPAEVVRREASLLVLSAGGTSDDEPGGAVADGIWWWLRGVRAGDSAQVTRGLAQLADGLPPGGARAGLWGTVGVRKALAADPGAATALARAVEEDAGRSDRFAVAASDLAFDGSLPPPLATLRRTRAERLARGDATQKCVAEALLLEEALEAEATGREKSAAAVYAEVLAVHPESLEAVEGLRRLARAAGDRGSEAAALARKGVLVRSAARAAEAFAEAALLLQEEGRDEEAAALFLKVLERAPADEEAYRRLHQILTARQDAAALEKLVSFKLGQTTDSAGRLGLLQERARLRLDALMRTDDAIQDLKRSLKIDGQHPESLRLLGRLAVQQGHFSSAVGFLESALVGETNPEVSLGLRLQLAEAHEGTGDAASALRVLVDTIDARPEERKAREHLISFALRRKEYELALGQLQILEAQAPDDVHKAAVLVRIGRVERDGRNDPARALVALRSALSLDPLGDAASELETLLAGQVVLSDEDRQVFDRVVEDLRQSLLDGDPLDGHRLERLRALADLRGSRELGEAAGQLLAAQGLGGRRGRSRDLSKPLSLGALAALMAAGREGIGAGLVAEVWPLLGEGVGRVEGIEASGYGASRHTRVTPGSEPRLRWLEAAGLSLGLSPLTVHVAGADELAVVALDAPEPTLVIGRGVLGGDPTSRFRVGRALFLLRQRAASFDRLSEAQVEEILLAAALLLGAKRPGSDSAALKPKAKALGKGLSRKTMKTLEAYRSRWETEPLPGGVWRSAVLRGAARFGLLVAGDLGVSLRALAGGAEATAEDLRGSAGRELIRFAFDTRYATLRREVGLLGERPSGEVEGARGETRGER